MHSYNTFKSQLSETCINFPNLQIKTKEGKQYLKGTIDILNSEQKTVRSFLIEIHWTEKFPYRFPKLFEVGGDIPCLADYHKYPDNSCCITVEPDEILECKQGISVTKFIVKHVIPYFANQCYKMIYGIYKDEYPHGKNGIIMYYENLMKTTDKDTWIKYVKYAFGEEKFLIGRNDLCLCGSGIKFKRCHNIVFDKLRQIGKGNILIHFASITI